MKKTVKFTTLRLNGLIIITYIKYFKIHHYNYQKYSITVVTENLLIPVITGTSKTPPVLD